MSIDAISMMDELAGDLEFFCNALLDNENNVEMYTNGEIRQILSYQVLNSGETILCKLIEHDSLLSKNIKHEDILLLKENVNKKIRTLFVQRAKDYIELNSATITNQIKNEIINILGGES